MKNILLLFFLFVASYSYAQEIVPLKFRGSSTTGSVALIISNRAPIAPEISEILNDLTLRSYRIALVKEDNMDISGLSSKNSPFVKDVLYVLKIYVANTSTRESVLHLKLELLELSSQKKIEKEFGAPRSNVKMIVKEIDNLLTEIIPKKSTQTITVLSVDKGKFTFINENQSSIRRGDEIKIQYKNPQNKFTESYAIVSSISSNNQIVAKDVNQKVQIGDIVLPVNAKRNRFSFNIHMMVPTLGEQTLIAYHENNTWKASPRWPVGFQLEGEYERFLPYQLISTTSFGIAVDGVMGTYIFTGIGYRGFVGMWEFVPYLRLGVLYNPLGLQNTQSDVHLQGMVLRFGVNVGLNIIRRIMDDVFIGFDIGVKWYPLEYVNLQANSEPLTPLWNNNSKNFTLTKLYPYIGLKVGWMF